MSNRAKGCGSLNKYINNNSLKNKVTTNVCNKINWFVVRHELFFAASLWCCGFNLNFAIRQNLVILTYFLFSLLTRVTINWYWKPIVGIFKSSRFRQVLLHLLPCALDYHVICDCVLPWIYWLLCYLGLTVGFLLFVCRY